MKSTKRKAAGRCESCGAVLVHSRVSVYRRRNRRHVLFQRVPALVCRECGQRIFEAEAVEWMEHALASPPPRARKSELLVVSG